MFWKNISKICTAALMASVATNVTTYAATDVWSALGNNSNGERGTGQTSIITPTLVPDLPTITEIENEGYKYFLVDSENNLYLGGENLAGQQGVGYASFEYTDGPNILLQNTNVRDLETGCLTLGYVLEDGSAWKWGLNSAYNMTAAFTEQEYTIPQKIIDSGVEKIHYNCEYAMALMESGEIKVWGSDPLEHGRLGLGTQYTATEPITIPGITNAVDFNSFGANTCALLATGEVMCWGLNRDGELADGTTIQKNTPQLVPGITNAVAINDDTGLFAVILSDGTVQTWGNGLTSGPIAGPNTSPSTVPNLSNIVDLGSTFSTAYAVDSSGNVFTWGDGDFGGFGDGVLDPTPNFNPVQISGLSDIVKIDGGSESTLALNSAGEVYAWGNSDLNATIIDTAGNGSDTPEVQPQFDSYEEIYLGSHILARTNTGTVEAWGQNNFGQLGNNTTQDSPTPVPVSGLTGVVQIASGRGNSYALDSSGDVWAWGDIKHNLHLQSTTPSSPMQVPVKSDLLSNITKIASQWEHAMFLDSSGDVYGAGVNNVNYPILGNGRTSTQVGPVLFSNASDIAVTRNTSLILRNDGTVWTAGRNINGMLGINDEDRTITQETFAQIPGLTGIQKISANNDIAMALDDQGNIYVWGGGALKELDPNNNVTETSFTNIYAPTLVDNKGLDFVNIFAALREGFAVTSSGDLYRDPLNWTKVSKVNNVSDLAGGYSGGGVPGEVYFILGDNDEKEVITNSEATQIATSCDVTIETQNSTCVINLPPSTTAPEQILIGIGSPDILGGNCDLSFAPVVTCTDVPVTTTENATLAPQAVTTNVYVRLGLEPVTTIGESIIIYDLNDDPDGDGLTIAQEQEQGLDPFVADNPNTLPNLIRTGGV